MRNAQVLGLNEVLWRVKCSIYYAVIILSYFMVTMCGFKHFPLLPLFVYDLVSFVVLWKPSPRKLQPKRMSHDFPSYPVLSTDMGEIST